MGGKSDGSTRVAYIIGVPLAPECERQWPQMGEVVRGADLIARVESNFSELTLEVGRRLGLDDVVVAEWTCDYGTGVCFAMSPSLNSGMGRPSRSPTTGANPLSPRSGAYR